MHPMLEQACRRATLPALDEFLRRLAVQPTRAARQAYPIAARVRRERRTLPA